MNTTEFDQDHILTDFLCDYIDGKLNEAECSSFEEYLADNEREKAFAEKALAGKKVLSLYADQFDKVSTA